MENKMYSRPMYKCGICDAVYDSIAERTKCETACLKKQEEEARIAAEAKKKEEYEARHKEVDEAVLHTVKLVEAFMNDYGHYQFKSEEPILSDFLPSRLMHYFF